MVLDVLSSLEIILQRVRERERERERENERERDSWVTLIVIDGCQCSVCLSYDVVGRSVVCDCGISWSYSLAFL